MRFSYKFMMDGEVSYIMSIDSGVSGNNVGNELKMLQELIVWYSDSVPGSVERYSSVAGIKAINKFLEKYMAGDVAVKRYAARKVDSAGFDYSSSMRLKGNIIKMRSILLPVVNAGLKEKDLIVSDEQAIHWDTGEDFFSTSFKRGENCYCVDFDEKMIAIDNAIRVKPMGVTNPFPDFPGWRVSEYLPSIGLPFIGLDELIDFSESGDAFFLRSAGGMGCECAVRIK